MNDFLSSLQIAATGLHAQTARMRVIAENLANADSAGKTPDEDPYRRRIPTFKAVFDAEVGGTRRRDRPAALRPVRFQSRATSPAIPPPTSTATCAIPTSIR